MKESAPVEGWVGEIGELQVEIRPAATLLVVRPQTQGVVGLEVLTIKRASHMRFLPEHIAFPGGAVESEDDQLRQFACGSVVGAMHADDDLFALSAIRECAEEVGIVCGVRSSQTCTTTEVATECVLTEEEQSQLGHNQPNFEKWIRDNGGEIDLTKLRFVGRWITPPGRNRRFDTRFFLYCVQQSSIEPRPQGSEIEWASWRVPTSLLEAVENGTLKAVRPTLAMLKALAMRPSVEAAWQDLSVTSI